MATTGQKKKVEKVMHEPKEGTLKSGSGSKVKTASRLSRSRCPNPASPSTRKRADRRPPSVRDKTGASVG